MTRRGLRGGLAKPVPSRVTEYGSKVSHGWQGRTADVGGWRGSSSFCLSFLSCFSLDCCSSSNSPDAKWRTYPALVIGILRGSRDDGVPVERASDRAGRFQEQVHPWSGLAIRGVDPVRRIKSIPRMARPNRGCWRMAGESSSSPVLEIETCEIETCTSLRGGRFLPSERHGSVTCGENRRLHVDSPSFSTNPAHLVPSP